MSSLGADCQRILPGNPPAIASSATLSAIGTLRPGLWPRFAIGMAWTSFIRCCIFSSSKSRRTIACAFRSSNVPRLFACPIVQSFGGQMCSPPMQYLGSSFLPLRFCLAEQSPSCQHRQYGQNGFTLRTSSGTRCPAPLPGRSEVARVHTPTPPAGPSGASASGMGRTSR
jgi:hypothetical protein